MKPTSIATFIVFLLLSVATASAQTCPGREEPFDVKLSGVQKGGRQFNIFTTYCLSEITAGRVVTVTVRIETELNPGAPMLEIKGLPGPGSEDTDRIKFSPTDPETDDKPALSIRKYNYAVQISAQAEPRKYMVQLDLGFPDNTDKERIRRAFALPVGVNSNGKLEISRETQPGSFQAGMFSAANQGYTLKLRNLYRDYTAYVESITVNSDPPGWISPVTMIPAKDEQWNIAPTGEKTFTFKFDTAPLSGNLIRGFGGTPPQLKFDVLYNDGFRRQLTYDQGRQPITIAPSIWALLGAVLLGLLFGAAVRALLEFMYFKKKITRNGLIRVVTYSLVFGLLVVLLAVAGQVEVKSKAFSLSGSYDNPLAMLMIGLVSALAGLQIFTSWYNSLKSD